MACDHGLLEKVKVACRVASDAYDDELQALIYAALADIGITDVSPAVLEEHSAPPLVEQAVKTYCRIYFPYTNEGVEMRDRVKAAYDEQKAQLLMSSDYTDWGDSNA